MRSLLFLIVISFLLSCDTKIEQEESVCYKCFVVVATDYCALPETSIDEITMEEVELLCDWTKGEITYYEDKGSFTITEKCFSSVQITRCYPWHQ